MAEELSRRGFLRQSGKAIFGPASSALSDEQDSAGARKASSRPALSPAGHEIHYDAAFQSGYIVAPGTEIRIPMDRRYSPEHLWVKILPENRVRVGATGRISSFFKAISNIILPGKGDELNLNCQFGNIEGGKINIDLISPLNGRIIENNIDMMNKPEHLRIDPYNDGWLCVVQPHRMEEIKALMTPDQYAAALS